MGFEVIPAIVREVRDVSALEQAVVENLHRQDLNALEEAAASRKAARRAPSVATMRSRFGRFPWAVLGSNQ